MFKWVRFLVISIVFSASSFAQQENKSSDAASNAQQYSHTLTLRNPVKLKFTVDDFDDSARFDFANRLTLIEKPSPFVLAGLNTLAMARSDQWKQPKSESAAV